MRVRVYHIFPDQPSNGYLPCSRCGWATFCSLRCRHTTILNPLAKYRPDRLTEPQTPGSSAAPEWWGRPSMAKLWHEESTLSEPTSGPTGVLQGSQRGFEYRKTKLEGGRARYEGTIRLEDGDTQMHAVSVILPTQRTKDPFLAARTVVRMRLRRRALNEGSSKASGSTRSAVYQSPACVAMSDRSSSEPLCSHVACVEARPHACTLSTSTPNVPGTAIVDGLEPSEDLTWRKSGIRVVPGDTFRLTPSADFWWRASKQVPCGTAFSTTFNVNDEDVKVLIDSANDLNIVHESVVTPTALSVAQPCLANTKGIGGETTFEKVVYVGIQPPDKSYILWVLAMMSTKPISRDNKVLLDWTTFSTLADIVDLRDGLNPSFEWRSYPEVKAMVDRLDVQERDIYLLGSFRPRIMQVDPRPGGLHHA